MPTLVVFANTDDRRVECVNASYAIARDGTGTLTLGIATGNPTRTGQVPTWTVNESLMNFDTSALGALGRSSRATLVLYLDSVTLGSVGVFRTAVTTSVTPYSTASFVSCDALPQAQGRTAALSATQVSSYVEFEDTGLGQAVNPSGITYLMIWSANAQDNVPVQDQMFFTAADEAGTSRDPKLTIVTTPAWLAADRVRETTTTTGAGNITLAGAVAGFTAFSAIPGILHDDVVAYAIVGTTEWEVGVGSWRTGSILRRDKVLSSSVDSGAALAWLATGTVTTVASGNMTPGAPAGSVAGDLWLCLVTQADNVVATMSSEWTPLYGVAPDVVGGSARAAAFYHVYTGSAPSLTVTRAGGGAGTAAIAAYQGKPVVDNVATRNFTNTFTLTYPSVQPSGDGDLCVFVWHPTLPRVAGANSTISGSDPVPTERLDDISSATNPRAYLGYADGVRSVGNETGLRTSTYGDQSTPHNGVTAVILLRQDKHVDFSAGTKDVFCTFPAQSGALAMASQIQTVFSYLPQNTGLMVVDELEIAALELGVNAVLEVS